MLLTSALLATRRPLRPCVAPALARADLVIGVLLAVGAALSYLLTGGDLALQRSYAPTFGGQADAFLKGHLWVDPQVIGTTADLTRVGDRWYSPYPPLPAILMVPVVALVGPGFPDPFFTIALGAANVGLAYLVVRRLSLPGFATRGLALGRLEAAGAAALLGWGTVAFYCSLYGRVWETAHIVSITGVLLYVLECAGRGRPWVAGAALAAAFLSRAAILLAAPFWLLLETEHTFPRCREAALLVSRAYGVAASAVWRAALLVLAALVAVSSVRWLTRPLDTTAIATDPGALTLSLLASGAVGLILRRPAMHWPLRRPRIVSPTLDSTEAGGPVGSRHAAEAFISRAALYLAPLAVAVAITLWLNAVRFGSPFDSGYAAQNVAVSPVVMYLRDRYGVFSLYHLARNAGLAFATPPELIDTPPVALDPWLQLLADPRRLASALAAPAAARGFPFPLSFSLYGNAIWSVSPALVFALRPPGARNAPLWLAAWLAVAPIAFLDLLYYSGGWTQFGYRYSLDYTVLVLVLVVVALRRPLAPGWRGLWWALLAASIVLNALGARFVASQSPF